MGFDGLQNELAFTMDNSQRLLASILVSNNLRLVLDGGICDRAVGVSKGNTNGVSLRLRAVGDVLCSHFGVYV